MRIDLNCDLGESFGAYKIGGDDEIMPYITSANIACGFHAGDPSVMRRTAEAALLNHVRLGAHPGMPDLLGFGRREMMITAEEAYDMVVYQVGALAAVAKAVGGRLQHVKPHGALYNMAAKRADLAAAIARAVQSVDEELILFGLAGSQSIKAAEDIGLRTASEVFADRTYQVDGSLTPRRQPDALITSLEEAVQQVLQMVKNGSVCAVNGEIVPIKADTVCLHGDGAQAMALAAKINEALRQEKIAISAFI